MRGPAGSSACPAGTSSTASTRRQQHQQRAQPDDHVRGKVHGVDLGHRRSMLGRHCSSPCTTVPYRRPVRTAIEASPRIRIPPVTRSHSSAVRAAFRGRRSGLGHQLDRGELGRLVGVDVRRQASPTTICKGMATAATLEGIGNATRWYRSRHGATCPGVHRRHEEPADHVGHDHHVGGHQRHRIVEDDRPWIDVDDIASVVERHALGGSSRRSRQ